MAITTGVHVWRTPQLWWRAAIVVVCGVGLMSGARLVAYFTTQSSLIVVTYFAIAVWWMVVRRTTTPPALRLRGGVTLWILITGLVSHVILNGGQSPFPGLTVADPALALSNQSLFLLHYVVPAMVLIDWAVFSPHGVVRWRDGLLWMLYPVAYGAITLVRAAVFPTVPDRFPYPFLDFDLLGGLGTMFSLLRMIAIIALLAASVILTDRIASVVTRLARRPAVDKSDEPEPVADTVVA